MGSMGGYLDALRGPVVRARKICGPLLALVFGLLCVAPSVAGAQESELITKLKYGAVQEQAVRAKEQKGTEAFFKLTSGEIIRCKWLAEAGDVYRYERAEDGRLVSTPKKDVAGVTGKVLSETPWVTATVHRMHCNGECAPTLTTLAIPAWPK